MPAAPARPSPADVTAAYDLGVDAYVALWSAVILPPAEAVVAALDLPADARVLDIGTGTGALIPSIRKAAPEALVVALDASTEMLRAARARPGALALRADAIALPIAESTCDGALLAFVLFHLSDPASALAEAARVIKILAKMGTVTWRREAQTRADAVWQDTLAEAGVPPMPPRRVDAGLDSTDAITDLLQAAGLEPHCVWLEQLSHQWAPETFWRLASGSGINQLRLRQVDGNARRTVLEQARQRIFDLTPPDFLWDGEVVCAVASKPRSQPAVKGGGRGQKSSVPFEIGT